MMYTTTSLLLPLTILFSFLSSWTSAQLTASLTSPGNFLITTLSIQNPSQQNVSILAWNNAFDNSTALPILFSVKDDQGTEVQLASTNAMRAQISGSDFFVLAPGQSYYRTIDLRQIMQNLPSGPSAPSGASLTDKVFTMYAPASFKGFVGDAATAKAVAMPASPIDATMASLQDITVQSEPLKDAAAFPMIATGNLDPTFVGKPDGIQLEEGCAAADALFDAGVYAHSLGLAANAPSQDPASPLFPLFFPGTARQTVNATATAATESIRGTGPHVDLYCTDIQHQCNDTNILGYSFTPSFIGNAYVVLCPSAIALGRSPPPCEKPGEKYAPPMSTSHVLFNMLMTLNNVVTTVMGESVYGAAACKLLASSTLVDPTKNPNSYAQLAMAHWAYGFGGAPYEGASCLPAKDPVPNKERRAVPITSQTHEIPRNRNTRSFSRALLEKRSDLLSEVSQNTQDCSAAELDLVNIALTNARALAQYASDDIDNKATTSTERWTTFFNGDSKVKTEVKAVYDSLAKWNTTAPYVSDIYFRCDPNRRSDLCKISAPVLAIPHADFSIILMCPEFFYYPISLECINPSRILDEGLAQDMAGSLLHELTHIRSASKAVSQIGDGRPGCYTWSCMTKFARDRALPTTDQNNLPEYVASNYEYFAYSARATRVHCRWSEYAGHAYGAVVATHKVLGSQLISGG